MKSQMTQLVCPHCHYEFQYNNGKIDAKIHACHEKLGYLYERRAMVRGNFKRAKEYKQIGIEIAKVTKKLNHLKDYRKLADQQREKQEFAAFKNAVKEFWGEDGFRRCLDYMQEETSAYTIADVAKGIYSKASHNGAVVN